MFLDFYQLDRQPFGVTPDPDFLYLGASHREALASLSYGVKTGRGIVALIAPPGMGKTTLLFRFLAHLRRSARTAFLFQTQCDSNGLLHYLLRDLGIDTRGQDFVGMHDQLNAVLLQEARAGRRFVLVIDEAQNLSSTVLETARLLSDFETPNEKLLQIVLAGQPQLAEKLVQPELIQLRQRISILARLEPFSPAEVNDYIDHRLRAAGCSAAGIFTPAAVQKIAMSSEGIPRNINNLCFNVLSLGCALGRKQIDVDLVDSVIADLEIHELAGYPRPDSAPAVPLASGRISPSANVDTTSDSADPLFGLTAPPTVGEMIEPTVFHADREPAGHIFDDYPFDPATNDDVGMFACESLEHAEARNAEILAEIVVDYHTWIEGTVSESSENAVGADQTAEAALINNEFLRPDTRVAEASALPTLGLSYPKKKYTIDRFALVAAVCILALVVGKPYWQAMKIAAGRTGRTVVAVAVGLAPSSWAKATPILPTLTLQGASTERTPELIDRYAAATPTPDQERSIIVSETNSSITTQEREGATIIGAPTEPLVPMKMQFANGTTSRPVENLRLICAHYLGKYDARVVRAVCGFKTALSYFDPVAFGHRVPIPESSLGAVVQERAERPRP